eukprot:3684759-Heterocapsa_arctica.AAC.1
MNEALEIENEGDKKKLEADGAGCAIPCARSHVPRRAPGAGEDGRGQQTQRVRGRLSDWMNNVVVLEGGARDGWVEKRKFGVKSLNANE